MKTIYRIMTLLCLALLMSCNSKPSLQEYFVAQQDNSEFIAIDVPMSLLDKQKANLDQEGQKTLSSIKKINFIGLPISETNKETYEKEQKAITEILKDENYQTLMQFNTKMGKVVLKYTGDDDTIDELIVFAKSPDKGLGLVRMTGKDMKPEKMIKLAESIDKSNVDISQFAKIGKLFK